MGKISTEVLMYCLAVKNFLKENEEAKAYFIKDEKSYDDFFNLLEMRSQKKFEETGEPTLTTPEFEEIRSMLSNVEFKMFIANSIFFEIPKFGKVCLN